MSKRLKHPLIPKGPTPAPKPEPSAEDKAKLALAAERDARAKRCMTELQVALAKHQCAVIARTIIFYDGRPPALEWDVTAQ